MVIGLTSVALTLALVAGVLSSAAPLKRDLSVVQKPVQSLAPDSDAIPLTATLDRIDGRYGVGQSVTLRIVVAEDSYVNVINVNPSGVATILYPNAEAPGRLIKAGELLILPRPDERWEIRTELPGRELVKVIATTSNLPLDAAEVTDEAGPFRVFRTRADRLVPALVRNLRGVEVSRWGQAALVLEVREPAPVPTPVKP